MEDSHVNFSRNELVFIQKRNTLASKPSKQRIKAEQTRHFIEEIRTVNCIELIRRQMPYQKRQVNEVEEPAMFMFMAVVRDCCARAYKECRRYDDENAGVDIIANQV